VGLAWQIYLMKVARVAAAPLDREIFAAVLRWIPYSPHINQELARTLLVSTGIGDNL
jgi:hypothetical protein